MSAADSREKHDLLDLFGKYDVDHPPASDEIDEDADLIEEKMKQFQVKDDAVSTDTKVDTLDEHTLEKDPEQKTGDSTHASQSSAAQGQSEGNSGQSQSLGIEHNLVGNTPENSEIEAENPLDSAIEASLGDDLTETKPGDVMIELAPPQDSSLQGNSMTMQPYIIPEEDLTDKDDTQTVQGLGFDAQGDLLTMEHTGPAEELTEPSAPELSSAVPTRPPRHRKDSIVRAGEAVNPKERYQQSHKPFDFQIFLNHLKKKSADPIVRYIRSFLVSFSRQASTLTVPQMIVAVRQFQDFLGDKFTVYEPFASMDAVDLENSGEGVEKLIMNRLYDYCFSPQAVKKFGPNAPASVFDDVREDEAFASQVEKFSWVLGIHLDVDIDEIAKRKHETSKDSMDYLDHAIDQLNKMNSYRAPRDKIICILNACKIIFSLLKVNNQETNADAFIPLLILVIIKAKTPNLISNLHYIERYRGEEWLNHGETSYYLSSIQGAITFVLNIKKSDLTIGEAEYEANMEAWEAELKQRPPPVTLPIPVHVNSRTRPDEPRSTMSPSDVLFASAEMFTKSISNFISPSPQERSPPPIPTEASGPPEPSVTEENIDKAFSQLSEVFPTLDKAILRDVIIMNKANVEHSLDVCLTLVNEN